MFNILLLPVAVVTYWEWSLVGMFLFMIKDIIEIRDQINKEIKQEESDANYDKLMKKYRKK